MPCAVCQVDYSDSQEICPHCDSTIALPLLQQQQSFAAAEEEDNQAFPLATEPGDEAAFVIEQQSEAEVANEVNSTALRLPAASTLLKFPTNQRAPRPQWRMELCERVREIQERKAREAALESGQPIEEVALNHSASFVTSNGALGLVSASATLNPIVQAALRRVERARQNVLLPPPSTAAPPPPSPSPPPPTAYPIPRSLLPGSKSAAIAATAPILEKHQHSYGDVSNHNVDNNNAGNNTVAVSPQVSRTVITNLILPETSDASASEANSGVAPLLLKPDSSVDKGSVRQDEVRRERLAEIVRRANSLTGATQPKTASESEAASVEAVVKPSAIISPVVVAAIDGSVNTDEYARLIVPKRLASVRATHDLSESSENQTEQESPSLLIRAASGALDLLAIAFFSSPVAAIIELLDVNWSDIRVPLLLVSVFLIVMFLYAVALSALWGRTWGMSMLSLRLIDARSGLIPTAKQCATRTLVFMASLATGGIGFLYALFDDEGRTPSDLVSNTIIAHD